MTRREDPEMTGLLLMASFVGAFIDWRYVKAGGARSSATEKRLVIFGAGISVALLAALAMSGGSAYAIGGAAGLLLTTIFGLWELSRWQARRKHPIQ